MKTLDLIIKDLSKLPGLGAKSAARIAYYLISSDQEYNDRLANSISTLQSKVCYCKICNSFSEEEVCSVCSDPSRDGKQLCVVELAQDVLTISNAGIYNGLYHVLGGAINPLEGIGADKLKIKELKERVATGKYEEIIIATNPTEEGDTTALYLAHILKGLPLKITRLASGLPVGGDLGYVDRLTLARSLRGRIDIKN